MALSSWLCIHNTKNMVVKIVHPGGQIELYDRPVLAAEIMVRNPRCCVTYPHVFREPSAVVDPDAVLMLGQKFYVVPVSTLRKLRQRHSSSPLHNVSMIQTPTPQIALCDEKDEDSDSACWLFVNKNTPKQSDEDGDGSVTRFLNARKYRNEIDKDGDGCLTRLLQRSKLRSEKDPIDDSRSSKESEEFLVPGEKGTGNNGGKEMTGSPKRLVKKKFQAPPGIDYWQPSLESINEE